MSYRWEKFYKGVDTLASSTNSIQERLADAYLFHIIYIKPEELPDKHQEEFRQICDKLISVEAVGNEGSVKASSRSLSDEEASEMASTIVSIFNEIAAQDWGD